MIGSALKVADLFAEVGFKISNKDFDAIKTSFNSIKAKLDELIKSTADFATTLTNLSLRTRLSPKLIQDIELLGQKAGVAKDDVHSMLDTMARVAQKAYWGYGNEFAQWGLIFSRNETSASALLKTLQKLNVSSPQRQREIANAIGLQLETALRFAEQVKTSGFNVNNPFSLGEKNIKEMDRVNIELGLIEDSWDRLRNKIIGSQSGAILSYTKRVSSWITWLQKSILNISQTKIFSGLFDKFIRAIPFIDLAFKNIGKVFQTISVATKAIGTAFKIINWAFLIGILGKIFGGIFGLKKNFVSGYIQKLFDDFLSTSGKFGREIKNQITNGINYLEQALNDILPDFIKNKKSYKDIFSTARNEGIFLGISKILDNIWEFIKLFYKAFWNFIKTLASLLYNIIKFGITEFWLVGSKYLRIAFLYVFNDLKERLQGTWLGGKVGKPLTTEELTKEREKIEKEHDKKQDVAINTFKNNTIRTLKDAMYTFQEDIGLDTERKKKYRELFNKAMSGHFNEEGGNEQDRRAVYRALGVSRDELIRNGVPSEAIGTLTPLPNSSVITNTNNDNRNIVINLDEVKNGRITAERLEEEMGNASYNNSASAYLAQRYGNTGKGGLYY